MLKLVWPYHIERCVINVFQQDPLAFSYSLCQCSWLPHKLPWYVGTAVHAQQHLWNMSSLQSPSYVKGNGWKPQNNDDLKKYWVTNTRNKKNYQINVTLLSVWSPSWTFRISLDLTCPVAAARNWTREVLPQPIGPSSNTGLWEARARASLLRLWQVESTSTKSFGFVC